MRYYINDQLSMSSEAELEEKVRQFKINPLQVCLESPIRDKIQKIILHLLPIEWLFWENDEKFMKYKLNEWAHFKE